MSDPDCCELTATIIVYDSVASEQQDVFAARISQALAGGEYPVAVLAVSFQERQPSERAGEVVVQVRVGVYAPLGAGEDVAWQLAELLEPLVKHVHDVQLKSSVGTPEQETLGRPES